MLELFDVVQKDSSNSNKCLCRFSTILISLGDLLLGMIFLYGCLNSLPGMTCFIYSDLHLSDLSHGRIYHQVNKSVDFNWITLNVVLFLFFVCLWQGCFL